MNIVLALLAVYLAAGFLILSLLLGTEAENRIREGAHDTQRKLADAGSLIGNRTAILITVWVLFLFWPVAVYGALTKKGGKDG